MVRSAGRDPCSKWIRCTPSKLDASILVLGTSRRKGVFIPVKTIVIGLGNPILGDDGVGWRVAEEVKKKMGPNGQVDVDCLSLGGIHLMEHLIGYERAIVIDAVLCADTPGSIHVTELDSMPDPSAFHLTSAHDTSLQTAMKLGRDLHVGLPDSVIVVGVSIQHSYDFSEQLSASVMEAVPKAAQIVMDLTM